MSRKTWQDPCSSLFQTAVAVLLIREPAENDVFILSFQGQFLQSCKVSETNRALELRLSLPACVTSTDLRCSSFCVGLVHIPQPRTSQKLHQNSGLLKQIVPMPNISFDVFFDQDFINVSASRGKHAPKAKPDWKVRTAPKLPPKEQPADPAGTPRPPPRPTINSTRQAANNTEASKDKKATDDTSSQSGDKQRRKPPKLGPKKTESSA